MNKKRIRATREEFVLYMLNAQQRRREIFGRVKTDG